MLEEKDVSPGFLSQDCCTVIGMPDCAVCKFRNSARKCKIYGNLPKNIFEDYEVCDELDIDKNSPCYENYCRCRNIKP